MAEKLLDCPDVVLVLEEVGGERVAEGVRGGPLGDAGLSRSNADDALEDGFVRWWYAGSIVMRSLSPLPLRTTIWLRAKSMSSTRRRQHSSARRPEPEQVRHQPRHTVEPLEHGADFVTGEDDGQPLRPFRAHDVVQPGHLDVQDFSVEEQKGAQRLVLGGGRHLPINGQPAQEARDLRRPHLGGMTLAMEEGVAPDPGDVGLLRSAAVVATPECRPDAV
jgi:hypothetical protein